MSFQAMAWAVKQTCQSSSAKLVLLMLADRMNHDTGMCIPKIKTLAVECCMSETTVKRHLQSLVDDGLISVEKRFHEGVQISNRYILNLDVVGSNCTHGGVKFEGGVGSNCATNSKEVNQESNQEVEPKATPHNAQLAMLLDVFIDEQLAKDFLAVRKAKRAPLTSTALAEIVREAAKANMSLQAVLTECVTRGWQSFKASWVQQQVSRQDLNRAANRTIGVGEQWDAPHPQRAMPDPLLLEGECDELPY